MSAPEDTRGAPRPTPPSDDQVAWRWVWAWLRTWWPLIALCGAIIAVATVTAVRPDTGLPLDPDSTGEDGTRALVDVLDALDRPVDIVDPDGIGDADVVLLLDDELEPAARDDLRGQVRAGTRLVVADPTSDLVPDGAGGVGFLDRVLPRGCEIAALRDVQVVRPAGGEVYDTPTGATGCFDTADGSWLVVQPMGRGDVVSLGGQAILTNGQLGAADNAVLAVQLLTPADGRSISVVRPTLAMPGDEQTSLADLLPAGVRILLAQLLIAFGVLVVWRARRLGPPLVESTPVPLASSEQTDAVGALLARNATRDATLERIARDTRRRLAHRLGFDDTTTTDELAEAIAGRTGQDGAAVATILEPGPPPDDADLLRRTVDLATVEREVTTVLSPGPDGQERGADVS